MIAESLRLQQISFNTWKEYYLSRSLKMHVQALEETDYEAIIHSSANVKDSTKLLLRKNVSINL
uniref:Uncharacterized protein n=1 Tax=Onchocerca volvulus TaxID=6282 RepID=A0A8R1XYD8_ONCVO